ncbi:hypothetical protein RRF57_000895 [Xylaria bambusicola]|uniref:Uncharacterized protein n=1 Tax=Xylaria bambusicola TaxID=326684 RepID=A0AAN7UAM1_9PEZI
MDQEGKKPGMDRGVEKVNGTMSSKPSRFGVIEKNGIRWLRAAGRMDDVSRRYLLSLLYRTLLHPSQMDHGWMDLHVTSITEA